MDRVPQSDNSIVNIKLDASRSHDETEAYVEAK